MQSPFTASRRRAAAKSEHRGGYVRDGERLVHFFADGSARYALTWLVSDQAIYVGSLGVSVAERIERERIARAEIRSLADDRFADVRLLDANGTTLAAAHFPGRHRELQAQLDHFIAGASQA